MPLTDEQIRFLRNWISAGALDREGPTCVGHTLTALDELLALRADVARLREALQAAAAKARSIKAESQTQHEALLTVGMICEAALTELIPRPPSG